MRLRGLVATAGDGNVRGYGLREGPAGARKSALPSFLFLPFPGAADRSADWTGGSTDSDKAVRKEMTSVPPDVPYTVLELVGKGSFGSVYKG